MLKWPMIDLLLCVDVSWQQRMDIHGELDPRPNSTRNSNLQSGINPNKTHISPTEFWRQGYQTWHLQPTYQKLRFHQPANLDWIRNIFKDTLKEHLMIFFLFFTSGGIHVPCKKQTNKHRAGYIQPPRLKLCFGVLKVPAEGFKISANVPRGLQVGRYQNNALPKAENGSKRIP